MVFFFFFFFGNLGSVWYMYLKIENYCLKIFVKIYIDEEVCENI